MFVRVAYDLHYTFNPHLISIIHSFVSVRGV
jgi:hypothetical protein